MLFSFLNVCTKIASIFTDYQCHYSVQYITGNFLDLFVNFKSMLFVSLSNSTSPLTPQVKAVKNEEASQVNRLNDEIRMLKEKLSGQGGGGGGGHSNVSVVCICMMVTVAQNGDKFAHTDEISTFWNEKLYYYQWL